MKSVEEKGKVAFDSVKLRRWESKLEVPGLLVLEDFLQEKKKIWLVPPNDHSKMIAKKTQSNIQLSRLLLLLPGLARLSRGWRRQAYCAIY